MELKEKLERKELLNKLKQIELDYADYVYKHKNGNTYYVSKACTVHAEGKDFIGLAYYTVIDGVVDFTLMHSRVLSEFTNGNFIKL